MGLSNYSGDREGESAAAVSEATDIGLKRGPLGRRRRNHV